MLSMAAGVDPSKGREAADIIEAARLRMDPLPKVAELARAAEVDNYAWAQVIKKGRGLPQTFLKMAGAVGAVAEVREALGLPPLGMGELSAFETAILSDDRLTPAQQRAIVDIYRSPGGWELLQSLVADRLAEVRQA
jgi:hypothetical protein